jgi:Co/Zn/Cd efflux system component
VLVNIGVLLSGAAIAITGFQLIDSIVGLAIGLFVIEEGLEIWEEARKTKKK